MLRQFMDESDRRAKFSAAVGIIGFIDVPVVFLSIQWWNNTIHPNVVQKGLQEDSIKKNENRNRYK